MDQVRSDWFKALKMHERAKSHVENVMRHGIFGRLNIAAQLDEGYRIGITRRFTKNEVILY